MADDHPIPAGYVPEEELEEERTGRRTRNRLIILGAVVALAVAYMVYAAFPGNALYFVTVSEFAGRRGVPGREGATGLRQAGPRIIPA